MYTPAIPQDLVTLANGNPWPRQGEWTYEDYRRLPDDGRRYEIIFGVLYVNAAPIYDHQYVVDEIQFALNLYIRKHRLGKILSAPFEVHLSSIAKPVQPDLLFVPKEKALKAGAKYMVGAPALVVEVLSPSTRRNDMSVKLDAYEHGGVREYWIADPKQDSIIVYALPENGREYVEVGVFRGDDKVQSFVFADLDLIVSTVFP